MTWLDIGNGWRNLYLLSCMLQIGALGCLFCARGWFLKKSRAACFLTGVAATPMVQYLWVLALAFVWPTAPRAVYIGALPALSAAVLLAMGIRRVRRWRELSGKAAAFLRRVLAFDKPALCALCFALCIALLLGPACVRFMSSMEAVSGGDAGEYMALGLHYCENRDISVLLEKEETVGHFRGNSHFPSLELFMSYGLFHSGGQMGYPYDKPVFTGLGMLVFYALAAYGALLLHFCREKKVCVLLGAVLFNLIPELYYSVASAPRDLWRILALLLAACAFAGMTEKGNGKQYLLKLLFSFALCFTVMSAHVVCFVVLPFIVVAWVLWRALDAHMTSYRGAGKALARAVGVALAGAAGTLLAFSGNIWCFLKWGQMSPWRLMTTFTDAPWYEMYMDIEYKLEETTTHLNVLRDLDSIIMGYATPIGPWGLRLVFAALACVAAGWILSRRKMRRNLRDLQLEEHDDGPVGVILTNRSRGMETLSELAFVALVTLLTLAPMSGVIDSPLYSFSGSFVKLPRYTLQWFFMANVMICAALAAVAEHWNEWLARAPKCKAAWLKTVPAWLCAALCLLGVVKGVNQTGYTNTFYRYSRDVMENESILLDNGFRARYQLLMDVSEAVPEDEKIIIVRSGYQYALRGRGYVLSSNPIVPLMNLAYEEVGPALEGMNVAMIATEPKFWDERYHSQSTLHAYLQTLPPEQVIETDMMRLYLLDPSLVEAGQQALERMVVQGGDS